MGTFKMGGGGKKWIKLLHTNQPVKYKSVETLRYQGSTVFCCEAPEMLCKLINFPGFPSAFGWLDNSWANCFFNWWNTVVPECATCSSFLLLILRSFPVFVKNTKNMFSVVLWTHLCESILWVTFFRLLEGTKSICSAVRITSEMLLHPNASDVLHASLYSIVFKVPLFQYYVHSQWCLWVIY